MSDEAVKRAITKRVYHFRIPFQSHGGGRKPSQSYIKKYRYRFMRDNDAAADQDDSASENSSEDDSAEADSFHERMLDGDFQQWMKKSPVVKKRLQDYDFNRKKKP